MKRIMYSTFFYAPKSACRIYPTRNMIGVWKGKTAFRSYQFLIFFSGCSPRQNLWQSSFYWKVPESTIDQNRMQRAHFCIVVLVMQQSIIHSKHFSFWRFVLFSFVFISLNAFTFALKRTKEPLAVSYFTSVVFSTCCHIIKKRHFDNIQKRAFNFSNVQC